MLALEQLLSKRKQYKIYSLRTERGFLVKYVINISERAAGEKELVKWDVINNITIPISLVVSARKAHLDLAWKAEYS